MSGPGPGSSTVDKAIDVLLAIADTGGAARLTQLQRATGHDKAAVMRLLNAWRARDFVVRGDDAAYRLGPAIVQLARGYLEGDGLVDAARPVMRHLLDQVRETVHLGRLDGTQVVYLEKLESPQTIRMHSRVGALMPAYATGLGKAILAHAGRDVFDRIAAGEMAPRTASTITSPTKLLEELERVRTRGFAIDEGENEDGVRCVAAPVFDVRGVSAAISVSAPAFRFSTDDAARTGPLLVEAAERISASLGAPIQARRTS